MLILSWMCCKNRKNEVENYDLCLQVGIAFIEDTLRKPFMIVWSLDED